MGEGDGGGACRLIAINPKLREEAQRVGPVLEAAKAPATRADILEILIRHAPQYGVSARSGGEWASIFGAYLDALEGLPAYAIEDAFVRWNRGEGGDLRMVSFYPKSGQLYILAEKGKNELYVAAYRAKKALEREEAKPRQVMTEEERRANAEAVRAMLREPVRRLPPQPPGISLKDWTEKCRREGLYADEPPAPFAAAPRRSPQETAAALRRAAAPVLEDVGDVI